MRGTPRARSQGVTSGDTLTPKKDETTHILILFSPSPFTIQYIHGLYLLLFFYTAAAHLRFLSFSMLSHAFCQCQAHGNLIFRLRAIRVPLLIIIQTFTSAFAAAVTKTTDPRHDGNCQNWQCMVTMLLEPFFCYCILLIPSSSKIYLFRSMMQFSRRTSSPPQTVGRGCRVWLGVPFDH